MAKSSGFGSNLYNLFVLLILTLITPTFFFNLSLLYKLTCWTLIQKVRYYFLTLTVYKLKISILFQLHYYWILFHLSFTVLLHYRSLINIKT